MKNKLMLAWRNPETKTWLAVGILSFVDNKYFFKYTKGACLEKNFEPFGIMRDIHDSYESDDLFPIFRNRLLPKSRPEHASYLNWLGFDDEPVSELEELSRSGGIRATDNLQLFPFPENVSEKYEVMFFSHGIRHLPPNYIDRVMHLNQGSRLFLMKDIQNRFDHLALALRTEDPIEIVGYSPRFFTPDFVKLIDKNGADCVDVSVVKVNPNSPMQFRLLCKLSTSWPEGFVPFDGEDFKPLSNC